MQQKLSAPFAAGMADPHRSDEVIGLAPPVQVYPVESPGQPVTVGSALHPVVGVGVVMVLQQNAWVVPSASAVPAPHESVASPCIGVMPPVHE